MMRWTRTLAALPEEGYLTGGAGGAGAAPPVARRVVLLTGQSSFRHSRLSPPQVALLASVARHGYDPVWSGFPYHAGLLTEVWHRPEPLLLASICNARQFIAARYDSTFRTEVARGLQRLLDHTSEHLLVITGSSGLHLWAQARPSLHIPPGLQVDVIALGPVMMSAPLPGGPTDPDLRLKVIQGRWDRFSQWGYRGPVDHQVDVGHLDYSGNAQVAALVADLAAALATQPHPQAGR